MPLFKKVFGVFNQPSGRPFSSIKIEHMSANREIFSIWLTPWATALTLLLIILVLPLTQIGMNKDGVLYAAIARNLSLGYGSLWDPSFSETSFHHFFEHPPLALYFQSIFFKLIGPAWWVEKLYSFLMALGQFSLIAWYWLRTKKVSFHSLSILLLLWMCIPFNAIYVRNLIPATLIVFTTLATFLLLIKTRTKFQTCLRNLLAAISVLIAFFCDGPIALFPLVVPLLASIEEEHLNLKANLKNMVYFTALVSILGTAFFYVSPQALHNTKRYFIDQVFASLAGQRTESQVHTQSLWGHLYIILVYFRYYVGVSLLVGGVIAIASKIEGSDFRKSLLDKIKNKSFILFLILSIISSWPVAVSVKQFSHYAMQSAPFFALAMMHASYDSFYVILKHYEPRSTLVQKTASLALLVLVVTVSVVIHLAGQFRRDRDMIQDVEYMRTHVLDKYSILSTSRDICYSYKPESYFERFAMVSLTLTPGQRYYLTTKDQPLPVGYEKINIPLSYFVLAHTNQPIVMNTNQVLKGCY